MKIITDHKLVKRNSKIGKIATFTSLGILGLGLFLSFNQTYMSYSFIALLVGFSLSQIGVYYGSRWGRSPRPDESLTAALKGLDNKFTLYHYCTPVNHLLVGPAGVWILSPYYQKGTITYDEQKKRWKQKGGNAYMKIFAQENLGRPDLDIKQYSQDMEKFLSKNLPESQPPAVNTMLVFTSEGAVIDAENAPAPTLPAKKLKDYVRRLAKEKPADPELISVIEGLLPKEDTPA